AAAKFGRGAQGLIGLLSAAGCSAVAHNSKPDSVLSRFLRRDRLRLAVRQSFLRLLVAKGFVGGAVQRMLDPENRGRQQRGVDRTGLANGERTDWDAAGHLDHR